jgi:hypothetical protein
MTTMAAEELHHSGFALQSGNVDIKIHPVNAFEFER